MGGCSHRARPVATFAATPRRLVLPYPGFTKLDVHWTPEAPLTGAEGTVRVFVHLLSAPGEVARTFDQALPARWRVGQEIDDEIDLYQSALGPPLPPGNYRLSIGLYDESGRRWHLAGGESLGREEYLAALVEVPPAGTKSLAFTFSGDWSTPEQGGDLQILARRWLEGKGEIGIERLTAPATVLLGFEIPAATPGHDRLVFDGRSTAPTLFIDSNCNGPQVSVSGHGLQWVRYEVEPAAHGVCVLELTTNFKLVPNDGSPERSIALGALALAPSVESEASVAEK